MNFGSAQPDLAEKMDADRFRSKMNSIAYGNVMAKAAEDYKQEMLADMHAGRATGQRQVDVGELRGDPDLERLHRDRLAELQQEQEKRQKLQRRGHGEYQDIKEADFLDAVTQAPQAVCHFFHRDFVRCKIVDKHLEQQARQHFDTRFIKVSAAEAPFFTEKLQVKVLPCVIVFINGVATERLIGFDVFGNRDDFTTEQMTSWLVRSGAVTIREPKEQVLMEHLRNSVRQSRLHRVDSDDEDSDFSD
mmetsp:Transcript_20709/g.62411  ORF Transcript_20709/g.62411 Transcript_20709/m.62411 type:complete len:247 (+) Transcript_20709:408-1148(+)|eukprot:CAMPEP_0206140856 /NCGR_PEP_ID=MMETSP1473-20131121/10886_1 /ASSEMBLY_ACC=CAM_ASM_001109 /TAXON_ID=1461547 /ORGANISM="Stichococcus sp, Strain RCC1054" /LENGTH=246 /DNA_ID=CAMNT_0053535179 /DNA_START=351 /DNA_END=1091 /DNA_ORIENTATION=-